MYTVIYFNDDETLSMTYIDSIEDLSKLIDDIVERFDFDTEDPGFSEELGHYLLLFDGELRAKPLVVKKVSKYKVDL